MRKKRGISSFSVIVVFLAMAMLGCVLMPLLPVKLVPSETLPSVSVSYSFPGASARTVEAEVTAPLEAMLARVSGVKHITSRSKKNGGRITLEFDRHADMEKARFETAVIVREARTSLPPGVSYPRVAVKQLDAEAARPFMSYTVNAPLSPHRIMNFAEESIRPVLIALKGVDNVELSGAMPMEWRVDYSPEKLSTLGLSPDDLSNAISERENAGCDTLDAAKVFLTARDGHIVALSDVARVSRREAEPTGYFRINGLNSIYLNITAAEDANQIELSKRVRGVLDGITLPDGFMMDLSHDASESIAEEMDKIYFRTALTILLLLVFVAVITANLRYLLIIAISLAVNMAIAFLAYYFLRVEIQLYSLAGITISLNLVIDNLIVMTEHVSRHRTLRAFSAVLAATLTTVGALTVVFFLDEKTLLSLKDFTVVVIVNLGVSLAVALFLVPALVERMGLVLRKSNKRKRRLVVRIYRIYGRILTVLCRFRWIVFIIFAAAFGWLVHVFVTKVYEGGYFDNNDREPVLEIAASLPNGATLSQMNVLISKMEAFLSGQEGIRQFQTYVSGPRRASVSIYFKPEYQREYPYRLKSDVVSKALTLGGGSWSVYGLEDQGFNNDVREGAGSYRIKMRGYNYDELSARARELADTLLNLRRIKEVTINSEFSYYKEDYTEFYLDIDRVRLAKDSLTVSDLFRAVRHETGRNLGAGFVAGHDGAEYIRLNSMENDRDVWGFMNHPMRAGGREIKLSDYATIEKRQTPPDVVKKDQEYILCLQYEYIGSSKAGERVLDKILAAYVPTLPLGYHAEKEEYKWNHEISGEKYWLLALVAVIIFFISSILFNSLRQPLAVILVIPVSFIGVFLTFYLFSLKFDKGGFAAMILLCGITVNAAIYIINEYNSMRKRLPAGVRPVILYIRAFRRKITAVLLTVLSTVLGFIPFLIGDTMEGFWFPLAAGTMGGLIMSLSAIFLLLPLLLLPRFKFR